MKFKRGDYVPEYLEFLRNSDNIVKIANLIEEIKKATVLGWYGDHFSEVATDAILERLYELMPNQIYINSNDKRRKHYEEQFREEIR